MTVIKAGQRRHLLIGSTIALGAGAVVGIFAAVVSGSLLFSAAAASALALVYVYATISSAMAYTRIGAAGVCTRGIWGRTDEYPWNQIANVAVQQVTYPNRYRSGVSCFVVVTTKAGDHVRLGAPASRVMGDPEFTRQFHQIRTAWQHATGITGTPETAPSAWASGAVWLGAAAGVQGMALVFVFVTLPYFVPAWAAHEGLGKPGVFTSDIRNCPQPGCSWFGTFTVAGSGVKYATLEPGGPAVFDVGQSVPAVDTGRKGIVYPVGGGTAWELPAAGLIVGWGVALFMLAAEVLVPIYRQRSQHRRAALATARSPRAGDGAAIV